MSTILHFKANGHDFSFRCDSAWTRSGFKHTATLYDEMGARLGTTTAHYINRTWEAYTYQSACLQIVRNIYASEYARLTDEWKEAHGYKRMTQKRKDELKAARLTSPKYELFRTLAFCVGGEYRNEKPSLLNPIVGNRELDIFRNLEDTVFVSDDGNHLLYKLIGSDGSFCVYDARNRRFVG